MSTQKPNFDNVQSSETQPTGPGTVDVEIPKTGDLSEPGNNESSIRSQSEAYNQGTKTKQLIHEEYNSGRNLAPILELIRQGRARDLDAEPKSDGKPVLIIGSGPSLDDALPNMRQWKGGIVCSPSHAATLIYHGVEPTHVMALDPFESWATFEGVDWARTRTKLVTHPAVWPDLIANWPNDVLLYRQNLGRTDSFYATTQRHMYSDRVGARDKSEFRIHIRTEVTVFACSPPCQLFVADRLGYGKFFLVGCDYAMTKEKQRFTDYTVKKGEQVIETGNAPPVTIPMEWEEHVTPNDGKPWGDRQQGQLVTTNNGLQTTQILLYYKKNTISACRLMGKTVYVVPPGSITELPTISWGKLISSQGLKAKGRSEAWMKKTTERYLAGVDAFVIETEPDAQGKIGHNFIESDDPETQVHGYMVKKSRQYGCPLCATVIEGNDDTDHTDMECPKCKEGKMARRHVFDIGKNMARIRELVLWNKKHRG
jgi:hypothetical protein